LRDQDSRRNSFRAVSCSWGRHSQLSRSVNGGGSVRLDP
jgi:hypothetical protein